MALSGFERPPERVLSVGGRLMAPSISAEVVAKPFALDFSEFQSNSNSSFGGGGLESAEAR